MKTEVYGVRKIESIDEMIEIEEFPQYSFLFPSLRTVYA